MLAQRQGDFAASRSAYQEALVIQRGQRNRMGVAIGLHGLANLAVNDGDLVTATSLFEENPAIAREVGTSLSGRDAPAVLTVAKRVGA